MEDQKNSEQHVAGCKCHMCHGKDEPYGRWFGNRCFFWPRLILGILVFILVFGAGVMVGSLRGLGAFNRGRGFLTAPHMVTRPYRQPYSRQSQPMMPWRSMASSTPSQSPKTPAQ